MHTLGILVTIKDRLNATAYVVIVVDYLSEFMTSVHYVMADNSSRISQSVVNKKLWHIGLSNTATEKSFKARSERVK